LNTWTPEDPPAEKVGPCGPRPKPEEPKPHRAIGVERSQRRRFEYALLVVLLNVIGDGAKSARAENIGAALREVAALQEAAVRRASLEPARMSSLLRRSRSAALLPKVRLRFTRGLYDYFEGIDSVSQSYSTSKDVWRFDVEANWSLDRLIFDRDELAASGEAAALSRRREELTSRVAELYFARKRELLLATEAPGPEGETHRLEAAKFEAILEGLTGRQMGR
jgi:hypothetical protein